VDHLIKCGGFQTVMQRLFSSLETHQKLERLSMMELVGAMVWASDDCAVAMSEQSDVMREICNHVASWGQWMDMSMTSATILFNVTRSVQRASSEMCSVVIRCAMETADQTFGCLLFDIIAEIIETRCHRQWTDQIIEAVDLWIERSSSNEPLALALFTYIVPRLSLEYPERINHVKWRSCLSLVMDAYPAHRNRLSLAMTIM
jgi:hypothetical protein